MYSTIEEVTTKLEETLSEANTLYAMYKDYDSYMEKLKSNGSLYETIFKNNKFVPGFEGVSFREEDLAKEAKECYADYMCICKRNNMQIYHRNIDLAVRTLELTQKITVLKNQILQRRLDSIKRVFEV